MNRGAGKGGSSGFTLIEVLVALAIVAIAFGTLFSIYASALDRGSAATAQANAIAVARSILARVGSDIPLADGIQKGLRHGIRWKLSIRPFGTSDYGQYAVVKPYRVSVTVYWSENTRKLSLETLRLAASQ